MHRDTNGAVVPPLRRVRLRGGAVWLATFAVACAASLGVAAWRHTSSLAFPIDDGYIYSNYVASAARGEPFTYNSGETSGGITSLGWYALCTAAYWLLAPLHSLLGFAAPAPVREVADGSALASQAGHLYFAAYLPGALLHAISAVGTFRLAQLALPQAVRARALRGMLCWLLGATAAVDLGLAWGAMSGLEVPLSSAMVVWLMVWLLRETERGSLKWALLLTALLPLARPELVVFAGAAILWALGGIRRGAATDTVVAALRTSVLLVGAAAAGLATMALIYWAGWGKPLPSSFYAKVGGLRTGERFFAAAEELAIAGRWLPFAAGATALAGALIVLLRLRRPGDGGEDGAVRRAASLLLLSTVLFVMAVMATLPWFGQEDRYLLPAHPLIIVLIGMIPALLVERLGKRVAATAPVLASAGGLMAVAALAGCYLWGTRQHAVEVRNIEDAHVRPALWIAENAAPGALVAAEPIGAVRLFSGRRTVDLVGLTTPATLGTYEDWARAWPALSSAGAALLLYYPDWFPPPGAPAWAVEAERFAIPDNRIAGDREIAVYELDWQKYSAPAR